MKNFVQLVWSACLLIALAVITTSGAMGQQKPPPPGSSPRLVPASLFGMNLYLTGRERNDSQAATLGSMAAQAGVKWSREELSWANLEPNAKGQYNWEPYDYRLSLNAVNGINVVGMLLTTPVGPALTLMWATTTGTSLLTITIIMILCVPP